MLLLGFFNYGSRGILDLTHTRLFTFATLRNLFEQSGYRIDEIRGIPAPFPLALGDTALARFLVRVNGLLIRLSRSLFAYQIFMVVARCLTRMAAAAGRRNQRHPGPRPRREIGDYSPCAIETENSRACRLCRASGSFRWSRHLRSGSTRQQSSTVISPPARWNADSGNS